MQREVQWRCSCRSDDDLPLLGYGGKITLSKEDEAYLVGMLSEMVLIFDTLMAALGYPKLCEYCNLTGSWHEQRRAAYRGLGELESSIDRSRLSNDLLRSTAACEQHSLVTPKTATLAQLLLDCKASNTAPSISDHIDARYVQVSALDALHNNI